MWNIGEEIMSVASELGIAIKELSSEDSKVIIGNVKKLYATGTKTTLWENITDCCSINDSNAWQWINEFIGDKESILFFNENDERKAFLIVNGTDLVTILSETYGFEFYITNKKTTYLLAFNHHDYLIACGDSEKWLKSKVDNKSI